MRKIRRSLLIVALLVLPSAPAFAVLGVGDVVSDPVSEGWLGEQFSLMTQSVANELKQITSLATIIAQLKSVFQTANEIASAVRFTAGVYHALQHYSLSQLEQDAMTGISREYPDLAGLVNEMDLTATNFTALEKGKFLSTTDFRDSANQAKIASVATAELKATTYSRIAPRLFAKKGVGDVTEADQLVLGRLLRKGMFGQVAAEAAVQTGMRTTVSKLVTEAEGSGQRDQVVSAHALEVTNDMANDVHRMKTLQDLDAAEREAGDRGVESVNDQLKKEAVQGIDDGAFSKGNQIH